MASPMTKPLVFQLSALTMAVFYAARFVGLGALPPTTESGGHDIQNWFAEHATGALFYAWTAPFFALALCVFAGMAAELLPKPHRYVLLLGAAGFAIETTVQAWIWGGLAYRPESLEPGAARTIFNISLFWGPLLNGATMTMAIALAAAGFGDSPLIPYWLKWLSIAFFLEQAVETITAFGESGFIARGGAMNVYLGGAFGFAWGAGATVWGLQQLRKSAHSTAALT